MGMLWRGTLGVETGRRMQNSTFGRPITVSLGMLGKKYVDGDTSLIRALRELAAESVQ